MSSDRVQFVLNGVEMTLTTVAVVAAARRLPPGAVRTHAVEVDGTLYPVKRVFSEATGVDVADFTTNGARSVLRRLGLTLVRLDN